MPTQDQLNRLNYMLSIRTAIDGEDGQFLADLDVRLITGAGPDPEKYTQEDAARVDLIYATKHGLTGV